MRPRCAACPHSSAPHSALARPYLLALDQHPAPDDPLLSFDGQRVLGLLGMPCRMVLDLIATPFFSISAPHFLVFNFQLPFFARRILDLQEACRYLSTKDSTCRAMLARQVMQVLCLCHVEKQCRTPILVRSKVVFDQVCSLESVAFYRERHLADLTTKRLRKWCQSLSSRLGRRW